ncbi:hypothetical protein L9F63_010368, partial [Diploptera punctata]
RGLRICSSYSSCDETLLPTADRRRLPSMYQLWISNIFLVCIVSTVYILLFQDFTHFRHKGNAKTTMIIIIRLFDPLVTHINGLKSSVRQYLCERTGTLR